MKKFQFSFPTSKPLRSLPTPIKKVDYSSPSANYADGAPSRILQVNSNSEAIPPKALEAKSSGTVDSSAVDSGRFNSVGDFRPPVLDPVSTRGVLDRKVSLLDGNALIETQSLLLYLSKVRC